MKRFIDAKYTWFLLEVCLRVKIKIVLDWVSTQNGLDYLHEYI